MTAIEDARQKCEEITRDLLGDVEGVDTAWLTDRSMPLTLTWFGYPVMSASVDVREMLETTEIKTLIRGRLLDAYVSLLIMIERTIEKLKQE